MAVLTFLLENGTQVVTRSELIDRVWGAAAVNDEVLTLAISRLRRALSDDPRRPGIIETIPKKGSRMMIEAQPTIRTERINERHPQRHPKRASHWVWVTILLTLLAAMTVLFSIVRTEYGELESQQAESARR